MKSYSINFSKSAVGEIESLDNQIVERLWKRIELLIHNPRPSGCKKLQGTNNIWRIRVGDYRILYSISDIDMNVDIIAVKHRKDAYK